MREEGKSFSCILIYREEGEDDDVKQTENKKYGYPMTKGEIDYRVSSELQQSMFVIPGV